MYDTVAILHKSPGQCHTWHDAKSSNCQPCLNFDVYTVDIRVACSLAAFTGSISSCLHTLIIISPTHAPIAMIIVSMCGRIHAH